MNKIATTLLISSLALGSFTLANADSDNYDNRGHSYQKHKHSGKHCDNQGERHGSRIDRMIERLGLNDEQTKQARSIRDNYRPKMDALSDKMRDNRRQLQNEMHADTINQNKVKKLAQVIGDLKTDKIILRAKMRTEIHKVLTKEQREEMKSWKGRRGDGHGHRRHGHGHS